MPTEDPRRRPEEKVMTRVLFIPEVQEASPSERAPALYGILQASHDVFVLPGPWDRLLYDTSRARWPRYLLYPLDKLLLGLRGLLLARKHLVEVVFCETAHHALPGLVIAKILGIRCVWDSHGNVKLFVESVGKGWLFSRLAVFMETFLGKRVDSLVTVTARDVEAYVRMGLDRSKIHVIPTCIDLAEVDRGEPHENGESPGEPPSDLPVLLFFGNFRYEPNLDGLRFINATLAPYLEQSGVRCEIQIAGRDIPSGSYHPTIRLLGFVPDIYARIRAVDLCVVPIWRGQGVLKKALDAMAVGTPLVMSTFAAQGIPGIEPGIHALVAASEESFLEHVGEALADLGSLDSLAGQGRQLIEEEYSWETHIPRLDRIIQGRPAR